MTKKWTLLPSRVKKGCNYLIHWHDLICCLWGSRGLFINTNLANSWQVLHRFTKKPKFFDLYKNQCYKKICTYFLENFSFVYIFDLTNSTSLRSLRLNFSWCFQRKPMILFYKTGEMFVEIKRGYGLCYCEGYK